MGATVRCFKNENEDYNELSGNKAFTYVQEKFQRLTNEYELHKR
jgi:hypothetical protein